MFSAARRTTLVSSQTRLKRPAPPETQQRKDAIDEAVDCLLDHAEVEPHQPFHAFGFVGGCGAKIATPIIEGMTHHPGRLIPSLASPGALTSRLVDDVHTGEYARIDTSAELTHVTGRLQHHGTNVFDRSGICRADPGQNVFLRNAVLCEGSLTEAAIAQEQHSAVAYGVLDHIRRLPQPGEQILDKEHCGDRPEAVRYSS